MLRIAGTAGLFPRAAVLVATAATAARAGIVRHDVPASAYTDLAQQPEYAATGRLLTSGGTVTGNLIAPHWVLTAAHAVSADSLDAARFVLDGIEYEAAEWIPHPDYRGGGRNAHDIGLLRLATPVSGVTPADRYRGDAELGAVATIVGFGLTGTGVTGQQSGSLGTKRAGRNILDVLGSAIGYPDTYILTDFDDPRSPEMSSWGSADPLPLEYYSAAGDSGGGIYISAAGRDFLAGVVSFGVGGPVGAAGGADGNYGDIDGFTRISRFNEWIDDQISVVSWAATAPRASFHDPANWSGARVPADDNIASFKLAVAQTVSLGAPVANTHLRLTRGDLALDLDAHLYQLTDNRGERSITVGTPGDDAPAAELTLSGGAVAAIDAIIHRQASVRVSSGASLAVEQQVEGAGEMTIAGSVAAARFDLRRLVIESGGGVKLHEGGGESILRRLIISAGGTLDLANNDLVVESTLDRLPADLAELTRLLRSARSASGGPWTGTGLTSSAAITNLLTGLALFDGTPEAPSFRVRYTWNGDANGDGVIDADDYFQIDSGFAERPENPAYAQGDFNYDALVDADDYFLIDSAFLGQGAPLSPGMPLSSLPVPEPAGLAMGLWAAALCLRRRRPCEGGVTLTADRRPSIRGNVFGFAPPTR